MTKMSLESYWDVLFDFIVELAQSKTQGREAGLST